MSLAKSSLFDGESCKRGKIRTVRIVKDVQISVVMIYNILLGDKEHFNKYLILKYMFLIGKNNCVPSRQKMASVCASEKQTNFFKVMFKGTHFP